MILTCTVYTHKYLLVELPRAGAYYSDPPQTDQYWDGYECWLTLLKMEHTADMASKKTSNQCF